MYKKLILFCLLAALCLYNLPTLHAQDAIPITYGEPFEGRFTERNKTARFSFEGKEGDIIYILPKASELFSLLDFKIRLTSKRSPNTAIGTLYETSTFDNVLIAELPSDDQYFISLTGDTSGTYILEIRQTLNLLPGAQTTDIISENESRFYIIRSPQPLRIALIYARLGGTFSPELRIDDFTQTVRREVAAVSGRTMKAATLELSIQPDVEYLVTLAKKPFEFTFERITPLRYQIEVKGLQ